ncbi:MAG: two-component sensor histidine kinase, partial [Alphaproteobacteria bacterium CG_4_10_14_0_8_um_filter_53_9]
LGVLTQSFNRMILQLKNSRALLEKKNKELDMRRRAMEAVLTGVTGAVLSVDGYGVVGWCNGHAERLLGVKQGLKLGKTAPEVAQLVEKVAKEPRPLVQEQVKLCCADNNTEMRTLQVRVVPQFIEGGKVGAMVVTADDITPLIGAQRVAAWRDVARRLAHEIKNPLTPIQLSAERLRRKYLKVIPPEDQELFAQLTETIVRQSEEMRRMTNEFSDFARMPEPVMQPEDIIALLEQLVALQKTAERGIAYEIDNQLAPDERTVVCDRGQIGRVLVNLIENASNAIAERDGEESGTKMPQGVVKVVVKKTHDGMLGITVLDNGRGLPPDVEVDTLFDPYVTTRKGGTGLGLAIVRKVIDEHKGSIRLARRKEGGTLVELTLPYAPLAA